jgi:hypothetical protein
MALPTNPTNGQISGLYTYDGTGNRWLKTVTATAVAAAVAGNAISITVNGVTSAATPLPSPSLTSDPLAKTLTFTDSAGSAHVLDMSTYATDISIAGATFVAASGVLTLTQSNGGAPIAINLAAFKAVNASSSIVGDGDATSLTLSGDAAAPGNSMYYGTNAAGVKGFWAVPAQVQPDWSATTGLGVILNKPTPLRIPVTFTGTATPTGMVVMDHWNDGTRISEYTTDGSSSYWLEITG